MKKLLIIFVVATLAGCYKDTEEELYPDWSNLGTGGGSGGCDTVNVTFSKTVKPIIDQNCATSGCHNAGSQAGGFDMSSYQGVKNANARLVGVINHSAGFSAMPQGGPKLDNCKISQITAWVKAGSLNN